MELGSSEQAVVSDVATKFTTDPGRWVVEGDVAGEGATGRFSCTIEWYTYGPAAIYYTDVQTP